MRKKVAFALLIATTLLSAQVITIQNPSFENDIPPYRELVTWWDPATGGPLYREEPRTPTGTGGIFGWTPPPWEICESTPDLMPKAEKTIDGYDGGGNGMWEGPASHGSWYLGLVCHSGNFKEAIAQPLSAPFVAGTPYSFSVDLAKAQPYANAWGGLATGDARFKIYGNMGSNRGCSIVNDGVNGQLLWTSPPIGHTDWRKYSIDFTPSKAWTHIYFTMPEPIECGVNGMNVLIDNISGIEPGGLKVTSPDPSSTIPCGHRLTGGSNESAKLIYIQGRFQGGVVQLTKANGGLTPDGKSWTVDVIYGKNFSGRDTLWVTAEYENTQVPDDIIAVPITVQSVAANFDMDFTYASQPVQFTDRSVEFEKTVRVSWAWSFGDGASSTERNPSHLYSKGGTWNVTEIIKYGDFAVCTDTITRVLNLPRKPGTMSVKKFEVVDCGLEISGVTNYRPDKLLIEGNIVGSPVQATMTSDTTWEATVYFAQGATGKEVVKMSAVFPSNTVEDSRELDAAKLVSVVADFSIDSSGGLWGEIPFTDLSTFPEKVTIASWEWSFGDGKSSSKQNPKHDYLAAGEHIVSLTVVGSDGCRDWKRDTLVIPHITLADTGHQFLDTDLDGKLDRVTIRFPFEVTKDLLIDEGVKITFTWLNTEGKVVVVEVDLTTAKIEGDLLTWDIPDEVGLKGKVTGSGVGYGEAKLEQPINSDTGVVITETPINMTDAMAPLIGSAVIKMATDPKRRPDTLVITFTEAIAIEAVTAERLFAFLIASDPSVDGKSLQYISTGYRGAGWSKDGKTLTVYFDQECLKSNGVRVFPLDSLKIRGGKNGMIVDRAGNYADKDAPWTPIHGEMKPQLETNDIWIIDDATWEELVQDDQKKAFGDLELHDQATAFDELSKGQLGAFLTIVVPTLTDEMSRDSLVDALEWKYRVEFYTNLGGFVAKTEGVLKCDDELFDDPATAEVESCIESRARKVWIPWNGLTQKGRKAGSGAYVMKVVFGDDAFAPRVMGLSRSKGLRR